MAINKPRTLIRQAIGKLTINDGDVVLVKSGSELAQQANFEFFAKHLGRTERAKCLLIRVGDFDDITKLDDQKMAELGWIRETKDS